MWAGPSQPALHVPDHIGYSPLKTAHFPQAPGTLLASWSHSRRMPWNHLLPILLPHPSLSPTNGHALLVSASKSLSDSQSPCFLHVLWFHPSVVVVRWSPPCFQSLISTHAYCAPVTSRTLCSALQKVSFSIICENRLHYLFPNINTSSEVSHHLENKIQAP